MFLSDCKPGQTAVIVRVNGDGPVAQRLMELGLVEGARLRVLRVAPLGDPMQLEIQNYCLSLRKSEARAVEVRF
ncbi:MAG: ferrous iron transport protein A [Candidatus Eisenbacteria bacterium]|nr:ferrous iron transport protein A [Candidatus Eisenbacteria bacterium]